MEELIARVFATRNAVHLAHWKTTSFAEHSALGDFYGDLIDGIDEIIEDYQGAFGLIGPVKIPDISPDSIAVHISDEAKWIEQNRESLSRGVNSIAARIDDFVSKYLRTAYKLFNLK